MINKDSKFAINVYSEIGKLKTVLLHRPGDELINLSPDILKRLLFDDIPDLKKAQIEHDNFAKILKDKGVEILYIEKLVSEVFDNDLKIKEIFFNQFLKESGVKKEYLNKVSEYLWKLDNQSLVNKMISGLTKHELGIEMTDNYPLVIDPLPNILFQRDPYASIGNGAAIHKMFTITRNRETLFSEIMLKHHPRFKNNINVWYNRDETNYIEGGDILVLNKKTIIIGHSQRTSFKAIRELSKRLLENSSLSFKKVAVIDLKIKNRAFMHLDTVLTNIDINKFIAHPIIFENNNQFKIFEITKNDCKEIKQSLINFLSQELGQQVYIFKCGGEDPIDQAREQWNDGANVLTISPGVVIAYSRNHVTVDILKKNGIKIYEIDSSELSRGRGGPRCMSMPIWRENI